MSTTKKDTDNRKGQGTVVASKTRITTSKGGTAKGGEENMKRDRDAENADNKNNKNTKTR